MRTLAFTATSGFSYYPNAVVDVLTIEFDNAEHLEALPEQIQLHSEKVLLLPYETFRYMKYITKTTLKMETRLKWT